MLAQCIAPRSQVSNALSRASPSSAPITSHGMDQSTA
jgi:hypothetical protein